MGAKTGIAWTDATEDLRVREFPEVTPCAR